jgi:hypothetical protein
MMEIIFRSIAHAGGIPVAPNQRIIELPPAPSTKRRRRRLVGQLLRSLGREFTALGRIANAAREGLNRHHAPAPRGGESGRIRVS